MAARPLVGVALGGGAIRGMAHIGVLKVLKKAGIPIDIVVGTSSGGIVAALYASGYSPERMEQIAMQLRSRDIFDYGTMLFNLFLIAGDVIARILHIPYPINSPMGLMRGHKIKALLNKYVGCQRLFGQTEIPLGITAVDARDGTLVVFLDRNSDSNVKQFIMAKYPDGAEGGSPINLRTMIPPKNVFIRGQSVALAARASAAVPGIFEPVRLGDRILVDGGIRENVPAYATRCMGADFVIAVDVGYSGRRVDGISNIIKLLGNSFEIVISEGINLKLERYADVVIRPVINADPWDIKRVRYCIDQGELAAVKALDEIKRKLYN
ncbi:patatin-like phospholipase family protein [Desulfoscipio sp. XC116]|uniref:patatin-like phospholipase family protein n=1 Tax=Desulfoscipio sp. XC116 TaxID=3144975 RepID=UPI00325BEB80